MLRCLCCLLRGEAYDGEPVVPICTTMLMTIPATYSGTRSYSATSDGWTCLIYANTQTEPILPGSNPSIFFQCITFKMRGGNNLAAKKSSDPNLEE